MIHRLKLWLDTETSRAARRYHVVGIKIEKGSEPLVIVGVTNRLKGGERVTLNLSANDPWTGAAP